MSRRSSWSTRAEMPASRRYEIDMPLERGRELYERAQKGSTGLTKRAVPQARPEDRVGTQGMTLYACPQGHVWTVLLVRDGVGGFRLWDHSDDYCESEPCGSERFEGDPVGIKIAPIRHWTMR